MFLLARPNRNIVNDFLAKQHGKPFSYAEVGATRAKPPAGFDLDHNRILLGKGENAFKQAREAVLSWQMFALEWVEVCWPNAPVMPDTTVAIVAHHFGFHSLSAARIVYVIDESSRYGFAYGTLEEHLESGEERFMVEWNRDDDTVWYDLLAFSRPQHFLLKLGYPVTRAMQRRFVRDSQKSMQKAIGGASGVNLGETG
jgi:uncharacterized protein (UPF0548 family)